MSASALPRDRVLGATRLAAPRRRSDPSRRLPNPEAASRDRSTDREGDLVRDTVDQQTPENFAFHFRARASVTFGNATSTRTPHRDVPLAWNARVGTRSRSNARWNSAQFCSHRDPPASSSDGDKLDPIVGDEALTLQTSTDPTEEIRASWWSPLPRAPPMSHCEKLRATDDQRHARPSSPSRVLRNRHIVELSCKASRSCSGVPARAGVLAYSSRASLCSRAGRRERCATKYRLRGRLRHRPPSRRRSRLRALARSRARRLPRVGPTPVRRSNGAARHTRAHAVPTPSPPPSNGDAGRGPGFRSCRRRQHPAS